MNIDWYICQATTEKQAILSQLTHELIIYTLPNFLVRRKYKIPFYAYRKDLCYMNFHRKHPYISFLQGHSMQDSTVLEKTTKSQYAKYYIREEKDIYASCFAEFIMEAITIQDQLFKK
ncbi:MAG: hypothetical protein ACJA01_001947 [Saprospiraceae bacterium]|jgi:hypothetical protein